MGLKGRLRKLRKETEEGAVAVRLRDGGTRYFEEMDVLAELFLAQTELFRGGARESEVLDAVRKATPESRAAFEERFEPITMTATIICPVVDGGWVETFDLLEDGTVKRTYHEGGSPEAERIRTEARQRGPVS